MFNNSESTSKEVPKISVIVRKRPISRKELSKNDFDIVDVRGPQSIVVKETRLKIQIIQD